jgi:thiol-disulfide isomerase/thioredoxin
MSHFNPTPRSTGAGPKLVCHLLSDKLAWVRTAIMAVGMVCVAGTGTLAAPLAADKDALWLKQVPEFKADAPMDGGLTVLYFTATWCGYCRQMERTTLANASVRSWLEPFARFMLDYDGQPEWVERYRITGVPAYVLVNARGEEVSRLVGMTEPDPFRRWLAEGKEEAAKRVKATAERQAELQRLTQLLDAGGEPAWEETRARVFELAARGEGDVKVFARGRLTARAKTAPASLFDGLESPDLMVRITVAGVLRKEWGDAVAFDPWADAGSRADAVARLRSEATGNAGKPKP